MVKRGKNPYPKGHKFYYTAEEAINRAYETNKKNRDALNKMRKSSEYLKMKKSLGVKW